jgi:hypothetical protein
MESIFEFFDIFLDLLKNGSTWGKLPVNALFSVELDKFLWHNDHSVDKCGDKAY